MDTKKMATEAMAARKQIVDAQMTLWNTRLEALVEAGDISSVLDHLKSPVEDKIDNCGCNVQCGALQDPDLGGLVNPGITRR
ncbi:hypothetical protein SAMN05421759_103121 [Roseivivax lentus]|uniref:Uncharacterized protein n=1 Tax=Roseivivax lentus TaxID=633194 RepID=A0A1N7LST3_9RHOB|nr:hypothetical protein [Roseivivax lentus]SIS76822.1 hypothetical protein SAMN05421759_103121 [Roseivivax lentus]